jgi:uncharacterized Zn ribbon protein
MNSFLILLFIICCVYHVVCINDLSIKGFVIKDLKVKAGELAVLREKYQIKVAQLESSAYLEERAAELNLVKIDKVEYISLIPEVVAKK